MDINRRRQPHRWKRGAISSAALHQHSPNQLAFQDLPLDCNESQFAGVHHKETTVNLQLQTPLMLRV